MTFKRIIYIAIIFYAQLSLVAQPFTTKLSDIIEGDVGLPVLQLKDGTTIFQYDDLKKKKMVITIFDKTNQIIVNRKELDFKTINYSHNFGENSTLKVKGWLDGNGLVFLYLTDKDNYYRVDVNPSNALIQNEILLSEDLPIGYNVKLQEIIDFTTGKFLITKFSSLKILSKKEIETLNSYTGLSSAEIRVHNNKGERINTIPFDYINGKFQHAQLITECIEDDAIYMITRVFKITDRSSYDKTLYYGRDMNYGIVIKNDCYLYLSKYDLKTNKFTHTELKDLDPKIDFEKFKILHNNSNKIVIESVYKTDTKYGLMKTKLFYQVVFMNVNKNSLSIDKPFVVSTDKLDAFVNAKFNLKDGYGSGMLNKAILNQNGNVITTTIKNAEGFSYGNDYVYANKPELIGFSSFGENGVEQSSVAYPYDVDHSRYPRNEKKPNKNDFDFMIVPGSKSDMIFLNNASKNFKLPPNKKTSYIPYTSECNGIAVEMINNEIKEHYLFGVPKDATDVKFGVFSSYYYNPLTNTYIVKVYDGKEYDKTRAAWIKID